MTIRPGFSMTVPILITCSEKNHSSPGTPICPVFGLVSQICPDLPISAAVCLRIGGQKLAQSLSVYMKIGGEWGSTPNPAEELRTLPQMSKSTPDSSRLWHWHPMIHPFGAHSRLGCLNCGHLNIHTQYYFNNID